MATGKPFTGQPKQQYECETCGAIKWQWPSQIGVHVYCSRACRYEAMKGRAPANKGKTRLVVKVCLGCGTQFSGPAETTTKRKFCSRRCAGLASHGLTVDVGAQLEALSEPDTNGGCRLWFGTLREGYGRIRIAGRLIGAHRASYEHHVGAIAGGLVIDHLCRVHCCINPRHLEPVTIAENIRRGEQGSPEAMRKHWNTRRANNGVDRRGR